MRRVRHHRAEALAPSITWPSLILGAAASGSVVLLSFPPFRCGWLMWFALTPLFLVHRRLQARALFVYGYVLAAVPITAIAFCIAASSIAVFLAFAATVPLAFAAGIVVATHLESRTVSPWARVLVFPAAAVAVEFLLGTEIVGVPATLALTQADYPLVIQNADVFGTAGTTFLLLLANRIWPVVISKIWRRAGAEPLPLETAALAAILCVGNIGYGAWALNRYATGNASLTVAALQPAIPTADYVNRLLDPEAQRRIDNTVDELTEDALASAPDLLVLSEGGNGRYNFRIPSLRRRLEDAARSHRVGLLVSSPDMDPQGAQYNALFSLGRDGTLLGTHRKRLLTPIGEEHLSPGGPEMPIDSTIGPIGAMVCFESCFPGIARTLVARGARVLLVSSSDAAFRNSALPLLHSRFSIFRAIENRRYLVQAGNTGPSFVVRPTGQLDATTGFLTRGVLSGRIAPREGRTPFGAFGSLWPTLAIAWICLLIPRARRTRAGTHAPASTTSEWLAQALRMPPPRWSTAGAAAAILATTTVLAAASVHLATRGTPQDHGAIENLATFVATPAPVDVPAATHDRLQQQVNTCGPAALAFVLRAFGMDTREQDVGRLVRLERRGTSMLDLVHAAEALGLHAWGERLNLAALEHQRTPVIAYLPQHFVVVLRVSNGWVYLFDPATGPVKAPVGQFARLWTGYTLQIRFLPVPEIDGTAADPRQLASSERAFPLNDTTLSSSRGGRQPGLLNRFNDPSTQAARRIVLGSFRTSAAQGN